MIKRFFLATSFALALFSCSNDTNVPAKDESQNHLVVVTRAAEVSDRQAFRGDDIKSFNVATGEITFKNLSYSDICNSLTYNQELDFYLDEDLLFTATAIGSFSSRRVDDLVFYYDGKRMYLLDGYPLSISQNQAREEAIEKRKHAWERFVRFLEENDLLTDKTSDVPDNGDNGGNGGNSTPGGNDSIVQPPNNNGGNGGGGSTPGGNNDTFQPPVYDLAATVTISGHTGTAFIGKSVSSFNPETREITFHSYTLLANLHEFAPIQLNVFKAGNALFDATVLSSETPQTVNDLVFFIDTKKDGGIYQWNGFRYYFLDGYPADDKVSENDRALRRENAEKRKAEWEAFVEALGIRR